MHSVPPPLWKQDDAKLVGTNGEIYDVWPKPYWYLAPSRTTYTRGEGRVRPLEFAFVLHNASVGHGLVCSLDVLLAGIDPKSSKQGAAAEAEWLLEDVRSSEFPQKPSRLRSYVLNFDRSLAEHRARDMFRDKREVVRCVLIRNGGLYHFADVGIYERLEGRPDDRELARTYWHDFLPPDAHAYQRLEVLASSALYFPDWEAFPRIDDLSLMHWMLDNPPAALADGS